MKSTGLALAFDLWDTNVVPKFSPKANDTVFIDGHGLVRHVVVSVNAAKKTADVRTVAAPIVLSRDVPWTKLHLLDESQNALRIVREATENK